MSQSVDMEISDSGPNSSEGEEDEEELNRLLNSLNGIEKCFLPDDSEESIKKVDVPNRNDDNETTVDISFCEDDNINNLDNDTVEVIPLPQGPIENTLSTEREIDSLSDSDVIVCEPHAKSRGPLANELPPEKSVNKVDPNPSSLENNQISSCDSDVDIVEHIESSTYLKKGFIDLTIDDENGKEETGNKSTEKDENEDILKQINKIKKALMKRKKKKKKRKKRSDERKTLSRTRSRSRSKSKSLADSDEDKIHKKLCPAIVPRNRISDGRKSPRSERSDHSYRSQHRRGVSSRSRDHSERSERRTPRSYRIRSRSPRCRRKSSSPSDRVKRRKEYNSSESIAREQLRKDNELAVKSLMSVNSVHQQTVTSEGKQVLTTRRTSAIIQEILTTSDYTQPFAVSGQTSVSAQTSINQPVDLDSLTRDIVASSNSQQNYSNNATTLCQSNADYPYHPAEETDKRTNENDPENCILPYEEFIL